jgi:hypothetical protein
MPRSQTTDTKSDPVEISHSPAPNFETPNLVVPGALTPLAIDEFIAKHGERVWAVAASGHGSSFTFGPEVLIPSESSFKTLQDAKDEAAHWCAISDTIGGSALVVHMPTYLRRIIVLNGEHPLHGPNRSSTEDILRTVEYNHSKE